MVWPSFEAIVGMLALALGVTTFTVWRYHRVIFKPFFAKRRLRPITTSTVALTQSPLDFVEIAIAKLSDADAQVRVAALQTLTPVPDALARAKAAIAARLQDEAWFVREAALEALGRLTLPTPQALDYFVPALDDSEDKVRATALKRLAALDSEAFSDPRCTAALHARLRDDAWAVRQLALSAVMKHTPGHLAADGETLSRLLCDEVVHVRVAATEALLALRECANDASLLQHLERLQAMLSDEAAEVRFAADAVLRVAPWDGVDGVVPVVESHHV